MISDYDIRLRIREKYRKNNLLIIDSSFPMDISSIGSPSLFCLLKLVHFIVHISFTK